MIKAIIFDCFGVVIADGLEAVVLRREKQDPGFRKFVQNIIRQSNRGLLEVSEVHRRIGNYLGMAAEDWRGEIAAGETRNEQVIKLILILKKRYKTALLSNVGRGSLKSRFSDVELACWFDAVVASGDVGMAKPDPEIYHHTASQLGVDPHECVFIDDRQSLLAGAQKVGMQTVLYENFEQMKCELEKILADPKR